MLTIPKQELQSLKERTLSLKENFKNFLKKEKATKKFKEFMTKQDILFNDLDENIMMMKMAHVGCNWLTNHSLGI